MAIPDIEESRRIAEELEKSERKRGGLGFELPLDFDLDDLEEYALPALLVAACIGLSFYLGTFVPILYLAVVFAAGMALGLAWVLVKPVFEYAMDNYEVIKDSITVLPALLLGIGMFVYPFPRGIISSRPL